MKQVDGMKRCSKCHETQAVTEFNRNLSTADGYQAWCKSCYRVVQAAQRQRNRERNLRRLAGE